MLGGPLIPNLIHTWTTWQFEIFFFLPALARVSLLVENHPFVFIELVYSCSKWIIVTMILILFAYYVWVCIWKGAWIWFSHSMILPEPFVSISFYSMSMQLKIWFVFVTKRHNRNPDKKRFIHELVDPLSMVDRPLIQHYCFNLYIKRTLSYLEIITSWEKHILSLRPNL